MSFGVCFGGVVCCYAWCCFGVLRCLLLLILDFWFVLGGLVVVCCLRFPGVLLGCSVVLRVWWVGGLLFCVCAGFLFAGWAVLFVFVFLDYDSLLWYSDVLFTCLCCLVLILVCLFDFGGWVC